MNSLYPRLIYSIIFYFFVTSCYASGIRGTVTDEKGEVLSYATIYVKQNKTGTATNIDGFYEIYLSPGNYDLVFQYLGYESVEKQVQITNEFTTLDVVLNQMVISLDELEVYDGRENPAYTIMRKAISKSGYHLNQLDAFSTQVYVKGTGRIKKIPWLLRGVFKKEGVDTNTAFVSESINEVKYKRPNVFSEKIISRRSKGEDNSTDPAGFINGSFYLPKVNNSISPLSLKAFAYYRFEFLGSFFDQGIEVNRIKVIPRSSGENVFKGILNIVDGQWAIHSLDLSTRLEGFEFKIKQIYEPIEDQVWLPVSHAFTVEGTVVGITFEYTYLATNGNYVISLNPDLDVDITVVDEKIEIEKAKALATAPKIETNDIHERLSKGNELTEKELEKVLKNYEKEERKARKEPKLARIENFEVDSLADSRDSAYWTRMRPIPLDKYEIRGYEVQDSVLKVQGGENINFGEEGFNWMGILFGDTYYSKTYRLTIESPVSTFGFNTVEGFHFDYGLSLRKKSKNDFSTTVGGRARYAFNRDRLNGTGFLQFNFGKELEEGLFKIEGGRYIFQYNDLNPIHPMVNTFYTLLLEENYLKIYEKDFLHLKFQKYLRTNLGVELGIEWANRFLLENSSSSQKWVDREKTFYTPNIPFYAELFEQNESTLRESKATVANLGVVYKPWQNYKIYNGEKRLLNDPTPTFTLKYRKAFSGLLDSEVEFDHIEFGFKHQFNIGANDFLHVKTELGGFMNDKNMDIMDLKHFSGNRTIFVTADPVSHFRLLEYYKYSTKGFYWNMHAQYHFRKFLFTRIPLIQLLGIRENLFANYLKTDNSSNYTEIGYSIDKIYKIFRLEFVSSFQDAGYQDFGVRIGIRTEINN